MLDSQMIEQECLSTERDRLKRLKPFLNYQIEDCLTLNIYVPFPDRVNFAYEKKRPVIFFVHGGDSFEYGTGNAYDLSVLASFSGFICVTFNYRLGILGFLALRDGQINGNFGLFDLQAAILWIRTNIDRFGGDPDHISLMGYGHGAALVHLYSLSKLAQGPGGKGIKRLILLNGSGLAPWATSGLEQEIMQQLAKKLNIDELKPSEKNTEELSLNGTDQLPAGTVSEHRAPLKYLELYTTANPGTYTVNFNKTANKTTPTSRPTIAQQIAQQLRTLSLDKLLELQRNLSNHHCGTSLGPVFSRHLFPRFLINKELSSSLGHVGSPYSYDKPLPITATLFAKVDLLIGVVANAGIQIYRKSQWYGSSLSKGLPECARHLYTSDGHTVSELLQFFYGKKLDERRPTARASHATDVMDNQIKEIISILTDGFYLAPAFQTLQLHDTLQPLERVREQSARRYMSIFDQPSELREHIDFGSVNKLQEPGAVDDLAYWFGAPLVSPNRLDPFGSNYPQEAISLSRRLLSFLTNFVRNG
ncbi:neuroligin [Paragonimus westermani]|uniref:Neuroligin n=1 Tax=Paragonimus westermani TaxID=34504 RepID=A0A5J4P0E0_9TREM|nr:neuroligin [Paragonimus westermani]